MCIQVKVIPSNIDKNDFIRQFPRSDGPYARYRYFNNDELDKIAAAEFSCLMRGGGVILGLYDAGILIAACSCSLLEWDSAYFGMEMARLDYWGQETVEADSILALVQATFAAASEVFAAKHIVCRVGMNNFDLLNALMANDFKLMDVQSIYVARRRGHRAVKDMFMPRPYRGEDRGGVSDLFSQVLFETRYTRDKNICSERSSAMYQKWMMSIVDAEQSAREVYVVEREGKIVAAGAGRYKSFDEAGVNKSIVTDGIFASVKGYSGAYIGITRAVVEAGQMKGSLLAELKVSASNYPANRSLQFLGYENVGGFYLLHKFMS